MKVKVAVIGTGNMGFHHIRNLYHNPNVDLVGMVDTNEEKIKQVQKLFDVEGFKDYKELLGKVDAVSIVTPTSTHFEIAMFFLENRVNVLLEKPITQEIDDAEKLIEVSEKMGGKLAIGHIERFNPVMIEMKQMLNGKKPVYIDIHRESPFDARIFDTDVISDLMIHDIDLIHFLLNEPIRVISAQGVSVHSDKNDLVNAQLISKSGVLISITTSRATEQKIRSWRVIMPEKLIEADLLERKLFLTRRTSVGVDLFQTGFDHKYTQEQITAKVLVANYEPLQMEINDFINSIQTGTAPKTGGVEGLKALKIVKEIQKATIIDPQSSVLEEQELRITI
ncbi:TPA: Gfo/Idh/MocA family oxidoreductase [Clostridioides difficile]